MNFLRKSYCLLRRDRIFNLSSYQFICNLSNTSPTICRPRHSKGHFGNKLGPGQLLCTKSWQRPRFQPRSRCISNSVPGLGLDQVDPDNCEEVERNSSVNTRPRHRPSQETREMEGHDERINRLLVEMKYHLDMGHFMTKAKVDKLVDLVSQEKCTDHQAMLDLGLLLLRSCGHLMSDTPPIERLKLAHHIVSVLQQQGRMLTVEHYNELLVCYVENRHAVEPSQFLETMSAAPNEETYHLLLRCVGDLERALEVMQRMKDGGIPVSESVFNALVYLHARTGDPISARSVFETMQSAQLSPTSRTYSDLLRGLAECGDITLMHETFREASAAGSVPSQGQLLAVVDCLAASGHADRIPEVLPWLPDILDANPANTLRHMLRHFVRLGLGDAVKVLINKLPVQEDRPFGLFVLQDMVYTDTPLETILSTCDLVSDRNPFALSQTTLAALRSGKTDLALAMFEAMKAAGAPVRPHYYWPLLIAAREKGEQELFRLVEHSRRMDVTMDPITLASYVLQFVSLEAPTALLQRLQDLGFTVTHVFTPLLCALVCTGRLKAAHQLCRVHLVKVDCEQLIPTLVSALNSGSKITTVVDLLMVCVKSCQQTDDWVGHFLLEIWSRVLNRRIESIDTKGMENIVKALSDAGLRCSQQAVELISRQISGRQQSSGEREWFVALTGLADPELTATANDKLGYYTRYNRNMTLEELKCHLAELKAKKMNTRGVLRLLLMRACQTGLPKDIIEAKEELESAGYSFSRGMKAALFDFYVKSGDLDKAKLIYDELFDGGDFVLDDYKAINYASLLATQNQIEEAVFVLDMTSKQQQQVRVRDLESVSKACRNLLVSVSRSGQPEDTRFMFDTLVELGYCKASNKMMGPLVKIHVLRDDLERAVQEFSLCVKKYRSTPLQVELFLNLIPIASDAAHDGKLSPNRAKELIEQVMASSMLVHDPENVKMAFISALAEVGNIKWLEQAVKESADVLNYSNLLKYGMRVSTTDKPDALKNMIEVLGRHETINISPLFMGLLHIHCRHGDTQGAIDLWNRMHELAYTPNPSFIKMFKGLLESHNVPFPVRQPNATVVPT